MSKVTKLRGWNVGAKNTARVREVDGEITSTPITLLRFVEVAPPTGDIIEFEMEEAVRDELVKQMTGGIEIAKDMPS